MNSSTHCDNGQIVIGHNFLGAHYAQHPRAWETSNKNTYGIKCGPGFESLRNFSHGINFQPVFQGKTKWYSIVQGTPTSTVLTTLV